MNETESNSVLVDGEGRLILSESSRARAGVNPRSRMAFEEGPAGIRLLTPTRLAKLYIEPTDECNLGCRTCIRNTWTEPAGSMSEAVFVRLVEGLKVFPLPLKVIFGGFGEPLFHPDIVEMVASIKALGATVELITNGTLLTAEMTRYLISAGLDVLWVSLDGASPESYADIRLGAAFPKVIENVRAFRDYLSYRVSEPYFAVIRDFKTDLGIVFVAMKRNVAELPGVIDLGRELGATRFMVTNVLPYSQEMAAEILYSGALDDCHTSKLFLPKMEINQDTAPAIFGAIKKVDGVWPGNTPGLTSGRCPFIESGAGVIGWDGSLSPCLALLHSHVTYPSRYGQSRRSVRSWKLGNLSEHCLNDLWNDPEHLAFRERVQRSQFSPCFSCGGCDLSEGNEADCVGNSFPTCGACLWAQGVVQCP
jgi:MoaA/NifB/PqqE/SkfB family radical SAM enzyme